jgi:hypothetical protein
VEFSGTYSGPLSDLQKIINLNTDAATRNAQVDFGSNGNQLGVAKILKAYYLWTLTDRWGPIPFSEALQGAGNFNPKYDTQEDIYFGLLDLLEEAIADFDNGPAMQGDVLYQGDISKWKKLANTLRMFIALRMTKVYPNDGDAQNPARVAFNAAFNDAAGYISDNSENLTLPFPGGNYQNTWFTIYDGRTDYALSLTMYDVLDNMSDERASVFGSNATAFPYGLDRADAVIFDGSVGGNYARVLDPSLRTESSDLVIVNAATSLLAVAEASVRGWVTGVNAAALYADAIQKSYSQWGLGSASSQIANSSTNFTSGSGGGTDIGYYAVAPSIVGSDANTTSQLERIQLQRYIAHYPDGIQAWCEWRRTGVPNLVPTSFAPAGAEIPRRYVYATNEYSLNPTGVSGGVNDLTPDDDVQTSRMWWDKP